MGALYRFDEPESCIMYIDATNFYGLAISQKPYSKFESLSGAQHCEAETALTSDDWLETLLTGTLRTRAKAISTCQRKWYRGYTCSERYQTVYIIHLRGRFEYPDAIHDRDGDNPLAPAVMQIKTEMLSEKQMRLRRLYYGDSDPLPGKLICSLVLKQRYVVFTDTLKFYIERGMKVTELQRAISFESKAMIAHYTQFTTIQRTAAGKDECKRNFFKLMNVASYRKTIENVVKRTSIKSLTDMETAPSLAENPQASAFVFVIPP